MGASNVLEAIPGKAGNGAHLHTHVCTHVCTHVDAHVYAQAKHDRHVHCSGLGVVIHQYIYEQALRENRFISKLGPNSQRCR